MATLSELVAMLETTSIGQNIRNLTSRVMALEARCDELEGRLRHQEAPLTHPPVPHGNAPAGTHPTHAAGTHPTHAVRTGNGTIAVPSPTAYALRKRLAGDARAERTVARNLAVSFRFAALRERCNGVALPEHVKALTWLSDSENGSGESRYAAIMGGRLTL